MEEILNALYGIANNFLHGLKCLNQAKVESRMRWDKIDKMEYTKQLSKQAEIRQRFG